MNFLHNFETVLFKTPEIFRNSCGFTALKIYLCTFTLNFYSPKKCARQELQKTKCFLYTVIIVFTSNHIFKSQRYIKYKISNVLFNKNFRVRKSKHYLIHVKTSDLIYKNWFL